MQQLKKFAKKSKDILFAIFLDFPFDFGKINIDIKIPFPWTHENNQERSKYPFFFQMISAKLLYSLCCGGPRINVNALSTGLYGLILELYSALFIQFLFQGCRDHTTGDYCDRCEEGYVGNATSGGCISSSSNSDFSCECNPAGSISTGTTVILGAGHIQFMTTQLFRHAKYSHTRKKNNYYYLSATNS